TARQVLVGGRAGPKSLDAGRERIYVAYATYMRAHSRAGDETACAAGTLRRASRSLTRLYDAHLARAGLTTTQFSILRTVQRCGGRMPLTGLAAEPLFERTWPLPA